MPMTVGTSVDHLVLDDRVSVDEFVRVVLVEFGVFGKFRGEESP